MDAPILQPLLTLMTSLLVAIVSARLTVQLSLRRFRTEKWWERKADTYAAIMEALYLLKRSADDYAEWFHYGCRENGRASNANAWRAARDRIDREAAIGAFVVSKEVAEALSELQSELAIANRISEEAGDDYESASHQSVALGKCIVRVRAAARRDLDIHEPDRRSAPWRLRRRTCEKAE